MTHHREVFLGQYCDACAKPDNHQVCGKMFKQIFEPIVCPTILQASHEICLFCLNLFSKQQKHIQFCAFERSNIHLYAAGWATPASSYVLSLLRKLKNPYEAPLRNLITELFKIFKLQDVVVVPIPLGNKTAWQRWIETLKLSVSSLENVQVVPAIDREKHYSTRKSVAQVRQKIASEEYKVSKNCADVLKHKRVVLLDDNVTTGNTIIRCAELLTVGNPSEIFALTLDRTIGPRVLQRCEVPSELICPYKFRLG